MIDVAATRDWKRKPRFKRKINPLPRCGELKGHWSLKYDPKKLVNLAFAKDILPGSHY